MFIEALFVIARMWKQPRYPPMEEWMKKVWNIYVLEYYSAVKNKDFLNLLFNPKALNSSSHHVVSIPAFPDGSIRHKLMFLSSS